MSAGGARMRPMTTPSQVAAVIDWIVDGARSATQPQDIVRQLCERLLDCGLPLLRAGVFVRTLHPIVAGRGYIWQRGVAAIQRIDAVYDDLQSDQYLRNPLYPVFNGSGEIRRRLSAIEGPDEFLVFAELRALGVTDYIIMPLEFTTGGIHAVSWTTDRPDGFSDEELDALRHVRTALARLVESQSLRRVARNILNAYLGAQAGERVLNGQIKRGDGDEIHAVIWFSDLRDSSLIADSMTRREFLGVLNEFFECTAGAVLASGGEVLRFVGDAVLAIFPVNPARWSVPQACEVAVAAARDAVARLAKLNATRAARGERALAFGIALHLGDVLYGNIGTPKRIEFSVIGAAANEAARIEALCKTLGRSLLVSAAVARHLAGEWRSLGAHALRGIGEPIELFTER
jgi:adenylate cyclase